MASDVVKGGWAPDEDERLIAAIERYGTRWSLVAGVVGTRNSDRKLLSHARHSPFSYAMQNVPSGGQILSTLLSIARAGRQRLMRFY